MKNIWLRERELSVKRLRHDPEYRPSSAASGGEDTMPPISSTRRASTSHSSSNNLKGLPWKDGYTSLHKSNLIPSLDKRTLKKTKLLLQKVESSDARYSGGPGSPGGHIARQVSKYQSNETMSSKKSALLRQESKPYIFTEDTEEFISFGQFDIHSRPQWDPRFQEYPKEIAALELEKRMKQRAKEKVLASSDSAVLVIMRDILEMYTSKFSLPQSQDAKFLSPDNLNLDETHVWLRIRIALHKAGEGVTPRQLVALANICRQYRAAFSRRQRSKGGTSSEKTLRVKIPPILIHFMRYLNLLLGGSSSFRSAQFILLRDLTYLLKLMQNIDPLKLPLENLRMATTFRMKDIKRSSLHQGTYTETSVSLSPNDTPASVAPCTKDSPRKLIPTSCVSVTSAPLSSASRMTDLSHHSASSLSTSYGYNEAALDSLVQSISSWIFSFSLLAKIVLVSAERTPVSLLMQQKNSAPNHSLVALRRVSKVVDCKTASSLFHSEQSSSSTAENLSRGNSRRGSLSSILGAPYSPPPSPSKRESSDSPHSFSGPVGDELTVSHHSSIAEEEGEDGEGEDDMDIETINRFKSEYFAPRTPPARFGELVRGDSRTYGELESLLLSRIESFAEFNYVEETGASSADGSYQEGDQDQDEHLPNEIGNSLEVGGSHRSSFTGDRLESSKKGGMELKVKEKMFRLSREGELLVEEENGKFVKATKNFSLYSDMITDSELRILQETYQQTPFTLHLSSGSAGSTSSRQQQRQRQNTELTAVDMLSPSRVHYDLTTANQRMAIEKKEQEERQMLLEKHHDFVETLCRITELNSQTERNQMMRNRKKAGQAGESVSHSYYTSSNHAGFGKIFEGM